MIIWIVPTLIFAGIVLLADFILRRRKWKENTKAEKAGLVLALLIGLLYCAVITGVSFLV